MSTNRAPSESGRKLACIGAGPRWPRPRRCRSARRMPHGRSARTAAHSRPAASRSASTRRSRRTGRRTSSPARKGRSSCRISRPTTRPPAHPRAADTTGPSTKAQHSASRAMPAPRLARPAGPYHRTTRPTASSCRSSRGRVTNLGDIPYQGGVVTPTCDPTKLSTAAAPNPLNTYANQLGCSISPYNVASPATTAHTATSYLFVAGIKGGLFNYQLTNNGAIGKTVGSFSYYSDIPEGLKLNVRTVSPDGHVRLRRSQPPRTVGDLGVHRPARQPGRHRQADRPRTFSCRRPARSIAAASARPVSPPIWR